MVEPAQDRYASGMNTWRAGCGGSRTSGSEGGPRKPTGRKTGRAPRSDPYSYLRTWEGFLYLAVVIDACTRRVVGWARPQRRRTRARRPLHGAGRGVPTGAGRGREGAEANHNTRTMTAPVATGVAATVNDAPVRGGTLPSNTATTTVDLREPYRPPSS
jgi:hypothetical protein